MVSREQFLSLFSIFRANGKRMLIILKINVRVDMILQTKDKTVSFLRKTQYFVLGHVTYWACPETSSTTLHLHTKTIAKFGWIKTKFCQVIANWIFPSTAWSKFSLLYAIEGDSMSTHVHGFSFLLAKTVSFDQARANNRYPHNLSVL